MTGRLDRFYAWCGFGAARAEPPKKAKGGGYAGSRVVWDFPWRDRLRVLVSGKIMVDMAHMLDRPPKVWVTNAAVSVLPPNYKAAEPVE